MTISCRKFLRSAAVAALLAAAAPVLGACYFDVTETRLETAKRLAAPVFMHHRLINTDPFVLTAYERVRQNGGDATIYIEGDGVAWLSRSTPSLDPTPRNPIALHLATHDNSPNVIYLARPCQYSKMAEQPSCPTEYWTSGRLAPEAVESMSKALDDIKARYNLKSFNLVGYSGGAGMAVLLAAGRTDVASIRTVAGNIHNAAFTSLHGVSPMAASLDPGDVAAQVAHIPQHHFIGEWDEIVTPAIYDSFRAAAGNGDCMRSSIVRRVDHENGWVNVWPEMLDNALDCHKHP